MDQEKIWLKLDNSAKVFPLVEYKESQNIFRLSAELSEDIDQELMEKAVNMTLPRFPSICVKMVKGCCWYYFDHNDQACRVVDESDLIMSHIDPKTNNGYPYRIMTYRNRVTIEFYHTVCDGTGGMAFLKSILYHYLTLLGHEINPEGKLLLPDTAPDPREYEDSFNTNYKPVRLRDVKFTDLTGSKRAYRVEGKTYLNGGKNVTSCDIKASKLHKYCKEHGWTITEYLGGLFMYSVYMTRGRYAKAPDDIILLVPINLRKMYESVTLRNFVLFARVNVDIKSPEIPLEHFVRAIHDGIATNNTREALDSQISTAMIGEKLAVMKYSPISAKKLAFNVSNMLGRRKPTRTATFSNIGVVDLPADMKKYVKKFAFMINTNRGVPMSMTSITVNDILNLTISRNIAGAEDIERFFFTALRSTGIDMVVYSNYWEDK